MGLMKEKKEKEKKQEDIGIIWKGDIKVIEKRSEILGNICVATLLVAV